MRIINDLRDVSGVSHAGIAKIVIQRISELRLSAEETLADIGEFIIIEPGDTIADLEEASGCSIITNLFDRLHFGEPDFVPNHEWLEHHPEQHCYEMVFIMTGDGYFTVFLIPDDPGIDPDLLSLCREYS